MSRLNKAAVYDKQYWGFTVVAFRIEEVVHREFKGLLTGFEYVYSYVCMHIGINISLFITKTLLQNFVHFIDITKYMYNDNLQFSR